jgi:hypothetical protein
VRERNQTTVDPSTDAGVADLGVHRIGEVDGARSQWKGHHPPLGCEHEDLVLIQIGLQVLHELGRVDDVALPIDDPVQPVDVGGLGPVLVRPVGGDSPLGPLVHLATANLDLQRLATGPDDRGVEALVQVELGHGHVVLEPTDDGLPPAVYASECRVAILHRVDDHANGHDVEDLVELLALLDHLLVDAPEVLAAPGDVGFDVQFRQLCPDLGHGLGEVHVSFGTARADEMIELAVPLRIHRGERQILELLLQALHAEAVGQRSVNVEGLRCDPLLLVHRHGRDCAHVVQTIGQLDDEDPKVLGHGDQHLAHGRRLLGLLGVELDALQFRDAIDDGRHFGAELPLDVGDRDLGVLHRVVQQGSGHRGLVEADVGDDLGHGQRVIDVTLTALSLLLRMREPGHLERFGHRGGTRLGVATSERRDHGRQLVVRRTALAPPGKESCHGGHGFIIPARGPFVRRRDPKFG